MDTLTLILGVIIGLESQCLISGNEDKCVRPVKLMITLVIKYWRKYAR